MTGEESMGQSGDIPTKMENCEVTLDKKEMKELYRLLYKLLGD